MTSFDQGTGPQLWERQPGETSLWHGRFERYRLLWPRSIAEAYRQEWREASNKAGSKKKREEKRGKGRINEPKEAPGRWYMMAEQWQWQARAEAWDDQELFDLEEHIKAERKRTLLTGYAVMHKRVIALNALAEKLLEMLDHDKNIWIPDAKTVAGERFDIVRFNAALIQEFRATLADLAAEMGERVKKKEIAITELPANIYLFDPDQDGVETAEDEEDEDDEGDNITAYGA